MIIDEEEDIVESNFFKTTISIEASSFDSKEEKDTPALTMVISDL